MALIRSKNTKPEMIVRRALHRAGLRFRLHDRSLPGTPDIVFASRKLVVTVRGCFWHRHDSPDCKLARLPKTRLDFWLPKLDSNRERDKRQEAEIEALGWKQVVIWECRIGDEAYLTKITDFIAAHPKNEPKHKAE